MSTRDARLLDNERQDDSRTPLLGRDLGGGGMGRDRGDLPLWRHILENKMTWAWYHVVISSGAVSLLLYHLPYTFHKLWVLGATIYVASLILFLVTLLTHLVRFAVRPSLIPDTITHPNEGLHVSTLPTALGILILNGATYAEKMHGYNPHALRGIYWVYIVLSTIFAIGSPLAQFSRGSRTRGEGDFTASTLMPTLPLLLAGPTAATVLAHMKTTDHHRHAALAIASFGIAVQGMGALLSLLYQSNIIERLHKDGFPTPRERPALFLTAVPPALTAYAFTSLAQQALRHLPVGKTAPDGATDIVGGLTLYYMGIVLGLIFWGLAAWWFIVSAVVNVAALAVMDIGRMGLGLFNIIFSHVAFFLASNELLRVFGYPRGLTILLEIFGVTTSVVWALVFVATVFGVATGRLVRDN